jgi:aspartyl-tRNA(Asn)/glutamyl-tRNA(Gln) amidotransferase subunit C
MTKINRDEVRHIARLARLGLTDDEQELLQEQLSNILENMEVLKEVDTTGVLPTSQSLDLRNVFRPDEVKASCSRDEMLANAPCCEGGFFKIHPVLE